MAWLTSFFLKKTHKVFTGYMNEILINTKRSEAQKRIKVALAMYLTTLQCSKQLNQKLNAILQYIFELLMQVSIRNYNFILDVIIEKIN